MIDMVVNILTALGAPLGGVVAFLMLLGLVVILLIGPAIVVGVVRSGDANIKRRLEGVWWAAYDELAADRIATWRGKRL